MSRRSQRESVDLGRRRVLGRGVQTALSVGLLGSFPLGGCGSRTRRRPNIILITLDTTRRDRLSCYGYHRTTSPNLDLLAERSRLYTRAIAPSNWTLPSHASLFTGKFTTSHGARFDPEGPMSLAGQLEGDGSFWNRFRARGLSPDEPTLAAILRENGYLTAGFGAGPWLKRAFGLDKGFDFYDDDHISTENGRLASQVTPPALRWLQQVGDREFFLFLNYFDPHYPYAAPEGFAFTFLPPDTRVTDPRHRITPDELGALYDGEIFFMDRHIGRLLGGLERLGLYENSWIIVTSDHGEMLGEHQRNGHGHRLFQQEIHVPLFMKYPHGEVSPATVEHPVQLTDILPIVLERLEIPAPPGVQGGVPPHLGHPVVSEVYPLEALSKDGPSRAIFDGDFKYVWNGKGNHALYDLSADPGEQVNLVDEEGARAAAMRKRLETYLDSLPRPRPADGQQELDEETQRTLRSLGYID